MIIRYLDPWGLGYILRFADVFRGPEAMDASARLNYH